ncbi:MAG: HAD-IA family hydrolase [Myxococcota bacterium]
MSAFDAWLFDLDGTLTEPTHDFAAIKAELGLPPDRDVLSGILTKPETERSGLLEAVRAWEADHLERARPARGAPELLDRLAHAGLPVGIVTRNTRVTARATLEIIGLAHHFPEGVVYGRDDAMPKPAPDALLALLQRFAVSASRAVMVGDHDHDLLAGRAAGATAVWVDPAGTGEFASRADVIVRGLDELLERV